MLTGFLVGLIGIGGGVVLVPALLFLWAQKGLSPEVSVRLAFGTSLAVAALTAASGVLGHSSKGRVVGQAIWPLALSGVVGAWAGATITAHLPGDLLRRLFGFLLIFAFYRTFFPGRVETSENPVLNPTVLLTVGLASGFISALLGIGGGVFTIPVLILGLGFSPQKVAGTSSGVIAFTATAGEIPNCPYIPGAMCTGEQLSPWSVVA